MHELKFRAWDKSDNIMFYDVQDGIVFDDGSKYDFSDFLNSTGYHDFEVMQYTGLRDKNGKEIYEGDILTPEAYKKINFGTVVVTFKKGMFCFELNKPFISSLSPLYQSINRGKSANNNYEVIGNIYENGDLLRENPELLEE